MRPRAPSRNVTGDHQACERVGHGGRRAPEHNFLAVVPLGKGTIGGYIDGPTHTTGFCLPLCRVLPRLLVPCVPPATRCAPAAVVRAAVALRERAPSVRVLARRLRSARVPHLKRAARKPLHQNISSPAGHSAKSNYCTALRRAQRLEITARHRWRRARGGVHATYVEPLPGPDGLNAHYHVHVDGPRAVHKFAQRFHATGAPRVQGRGAVS